MSHVTCVIKIIFRLAQLQSVPQMMTAFLRSMLLKEVITTILAIQLQKDLNQMLERAMAIESVVKISK